MSKENRVEKNEEMSIRGSRGTAERTAEKKRWNNKKESEWVSEAGSQRHKSSVITIIKSVLKKQREERKKIIYGPMKKR